jgi:hypothetical protein
LRHQGRNALSAGILSESDSPRLLTLLPETPFYIDQARLMIVSGVQYGRWVKMPVSSKQWKTDSKQQCEVCYRLNAETNGQFDVTFKGGL